ncbi:ROK family protein [Thalassomonas viridans]|uniref:ROK family protein n=1 Tax=Thalassomonas viridans TaxID=137584 RepID=A0AAE9Z3L9_9GAMM|nr:ROK family protein [Thalassomonas viridans]WDE04628.1 ROK family protein [Thalassomonas viridans]
MKAIVVDIGGTNLRVALFEHNQLKQIKRDKVCSFAVSKLKGQELYQAFLSQLESTLLPYLEQYPDCPLAIAFPGPVSPSGMVTSAPTLWGDEVRRVDFLGDCKKRFQRRVVLMNDISAAVWRYAGKSVGKSADKSAETSLKGSEDFCLFTISSGVGNKVFLGGKVLLNEHGLGGELGHCQLAFDEYALPCDCGGSGHLGALASGRGIEQLSRHMASAAPAEFAVSELARLCREDISQIDTRKFIAALQSGDEFCRRVLKRSQHYLVQAMSHLYHSIGIKRFIFIGGFCCAAGQLYLDNLKQVVREFSWFGLAESDMENMCRLGALDDDHSLLGLGHYLSGGAYDA